MVKEDKKEESFKNLDDLERKELDLMECPIEETKDQLNDSFSSHSQNLEEDENLIMQGYLSDENNTNAKNEGEHTRAKYGLRDRV